MILQSRIRSFLADCLNPPAPGRLRFSAYNLFKLREKLSPAERDYFYKVVDDARRENQQRDGRWTSGSSGTPLKTRS